MSETLTTRAKALKEQAAAVGKLPTPANIAAASAIVGRMTDLIVDLAEKVDALTVGEGG